MSSIYSGMGQGLLERLVFVTALIMLNLVVSVWQALKEKNFSAKKLVNFVTEWFYCAIAIITIDVCAAYAGTMSEWVKTLFVGAREVMVVAIAACYIKKIFESLKAIGWSVDTSKIEEVLDAGEETGKEDVENKVRGGI